MRKTRKRTLTQEDIEIMELDLKLSRFVMIAMTIAFLVK